MASAKSSIGSGTGLGLTSTWRPAASATASRANPEDRVSRTIRSLSPSGGIACRRRCCREPAEDWNVQLPRRIRRARSRGTFSGRGLARRAGAVDPEWHEAPGTAEPDWHEEDLVEEDEVEAVADRAAAARRPSSRRPRWRANPGPTNCRRCGRSGLATPRNGVPDDLQRIRGIGKKNEELLNSLGIFHFGQIAAWTPAEIRWVGLQIKFPERIERDDWIGQATILASGGRTGYIKAEDRSRVAEEDAEAEQLRRRRPRRPRLGVRPPAPAAHRDRRPAGSTGIDGVDRRCRRLRSG